jgi:hypothetical protein
MFLESRPLSPGEVLMGLLSIVGFVLGVIGNITGTARGPTLITLFATAGGILLTLLVALARQTFVIVGYRKVMILLERLARRANRSIWTVRTHLGSGELEQRYFNIIRERIVAADDPLEDFRRIVRIVENSATGQHLAWLVQSFADQPAARIKFFEGGGPSFDFVIFDGTTAVIGFPQSGGLDNAAAIVIRGRKAVAGVESVFDALFALSTTFFSGDRRITTDERERLLTFAQELAASRSGETPVSVLASTTGVSATAPDDQG